MTKAVLRTTFLQNTKRFLNEPSLNKSQLDAKICGFLRSVIKGPLSFVAGFLALQTEPDLSPLFKASAWQWVFPRVDGENLNFYKLNEQGVSAGQLGVKEPQASPEHKILLNDCQMVCVPGVAFDHEGRRLGRGKGYYDRALANYQGTKVGVAYSAQISDSLIPYDSWDIRMSYLVTDKGILQF